MDEILNISNCNIAQIIGETNRFMFHIILAHIATYIIEDNKKLFNEDLFRSLLITAVAVLLYHILFRKTIEPLIEKMKLICYDDDTRNIKKKNINKKKNK